MTVDEFVEICSSCGYASKPIARAYAEGQEALTEDDFIEAYRLNERHLDAINRRAEQCGRRVIVYSEGGVAKTTKHYRPEDY